jgi:hypothetical protein
LYDTCIEATARGSAADTSRATLGKCVTNSVSGPPSPARCASVAVAMAQPSTVAVPRPSSSKMTSERGVAARKMAEASLISSKNVLLPVASESEAPMRVKMPSHTVSDADAAVT